MNLLPLETWREIMSYNPWHFWGLSNDKVPVTSACSSLIKEYAWQNTNALGRAEMRHAIEQAERRILEQAGFAIAPHYVSDPNVQYPRYHDARENYAASIDADGRWLGVFASEKRIQAVGIEALDLIDTVLVTYSDDDNDGLKENFTLSLPTSVTNVSEIAVYFSDADRYNNSPRGARWRIEPVDVVISGGIATITGRSWLLVRPILYQGVRPTGLDPDTPANFATTLDVVRRHCDPSGQTNDTSQALLIWETRPYPGWAFGCGGGTFLPGNNSTDPAAEAFANARGGIRDSLTGELTAGAAVYDDTTGTFNGVSWGMCRPPDRITMRYLAGYPLDSDGHVSGEWAVPTARMAAAEMTRKPCACDTANAEFYIWNFDVSRAAGAGDEQYTVSREDLTNPFGTRRGQIDAWRKVRSLRILRGIPS